MDTVDAVARALANAIWGGSPLIEDAFELLSDGEQDTYRSWARAAIDALGLTEESHSYQETETKAESGGEGVLAYAGQTTRVLGWVTDTRLVSGWVRKDNTNE